MGVSGLRELRQLKGENGKLKQIVTDLSLDTTILQEALQKNSSGGLVPNAAELGQGGIPAGAVWCCYRGVGDRAVGQAVQLVALRVAPVPIGCYPSIGCQGALLEVQIQTAVAVDVLPGRHGNAVETGVRCDSVKRGRVIWSDSLAALCTKRQTAPSGQAHCISECEGP